jgi:hypothetical protein
MQQPGRSPLARRHPTGGSDRALRARDNHRRMPPSKTLHSICQPAQPVVKCMCRKSASCAFCVDQLRGRVLDGRHGRVWKQWGVRTVETWYKKTASCAFCVDQLRGRVLDESHGRAWKRWGVRAVETWYRKTASCAFCVDTLEWGWLY